MDQFFCLGHSSSYLHWRSLTQDIHWYIGRLSYLLNRMFITWAVVLPEFEEEYTVIWFLSHYVLVLKWKYTQPELYFKPTKMISSNYESLLSSSVIYDIYSPKFLTSILLYIMSNYRERRKYICKGYLQTLLYVWKKNVWMLWL